MMLMRGHVRAMMAAIAALGFFCGAQKGYAADDPQSYLVDQIKLARERGDQYLADMYEDLLRNVYGAKGSAVVSATDVKETTPEQFSAKAFLDAYEAKQHPASVLAEPAEIKTSEPVPTKAKASGATEKTTEKRSFFGSKKKGGAATATVKVEMIDLATSAAASHEIELPVGSTVKVTSDTIKRFLNTTPESVSVTRETGNTIAITGRAPGSAVVHVWDGKGRKSVIAQVYVKTVSSRSKELIRMTPPDGIRFAFSNNWSTYSKGSRFYRQKHRSSSYSQSFETQGYVPLGYWYSDIVWAESRRELDHTSSFVSLSQGNAGFLKDFSVRALDISEGTSMFTLPSSSVEGVAFETPMFNELMSYKVFTGKKRGMSGYLLAGSQPTSDRYTGFTYTLFPKKDHSIDLNYAEVSGPAVNPDYSNKAYSVETRHTMGKTRAFTETATDEKRYAFNSGASTYNDRSAFTVDLHRVDAGYRTVSGGGSWAGETGSSFNANFDPTQKTNYNYNAYVFRDKTSLSAEDPDYVNNRQSFSWSHYLDDTMSVGQLYGYDNLRGSSQPSRSYNANSFVRKRFLPDFSLLKSFEWTNGHRYQRSIYPLSNTATYDRNALYSQIRFPIGKRVHWFSKYEYSMVNEFKTGDHSYPRVIDHGIDYFNFFSNKFVFSTMTYYRDEEGSGSAHAFLSGTDSLNNNANLTYHATSDMSFNLGGSLRTVWAEQASREKGSSLEVRLSSTIGWDSFVCWGALAKIRGRVFSDKNGNGVFDAGDKPMPGISVRVGDKTCVTAPDGAYMVKLRAKEALVDIDPSSLPKGTSFTTPSSVSAKITSGGTRTIDFGISSSTAVHAVVFYDINRSKTFERSDIPLAQVKVSFDKGAKMGKTNATGVCFFNQIKPGAHEVALDVNSLPEKYVPSGKFKNKIDVAEGATEIVYFPLDKK
jgi:hypothetical protein